MAEKTTSEATVQDGSYRKLAGGLIGGDSPKNAENYFLKLARRRIPIFGWLPEYRAEYFSKDLAGGISLGLMCLSQTLAQAAIATTLPINGPYCAFVPPIIYAILGTSKHASVSSGAMGCIIIASVLEQMDPSMSVEDRTELAVLLAFIAGIFQIVMGMCNLAFAVRFLSQATISGFVSGGAMLIMSSQLKNLCGYASMPPAQGFFALIPGATKKLVAAVQNWRNINVPNFALCIGLLIVLDICKRTKGYAKKKAAKGSLLWSILHKSVEMKELMVIIIGTIFAFYTMKDSGSALIPIVGDIPTGLPSLKSPFSGDAVVKLLNGPTADIQGFIVSGAMIAFTSFLTTYASNKKIALAKGYDLDASQELFAIGAASAVGSFFGAFLVCGSLSRTALAAQMGTSSQVCSLVIAGIIALSLCFLGPVLYFLPTASLAAIVMTSASGLIDFDTARDIWRSSKKAFHEGLNKDFAVWCVGFSFTILFGALNGICIAVLVGIGQVVAEATAPRAATLGAVHELGGQMRDIKVWPTAETTPGLLVFKFRGPICFCSAEGFHEELTSRLEEDTRAVVLDFASVDYIDYSALLVLKEILGVFEKQQIQCIVGGANSSVEHLLTEKLGKDIKKEAEKEKDKPNEKEKPGLEIFAGISVLEAILLMKRRMSSEYIRRHSIDERFLKDVREAEEKFLKSLLDNNLHEN